MERHLPYDVVVELLAAETARELAATATRFAAEHLSDAAVIYGASGESFAVLASHGLPPSQTQAALERQELPDFVAVVAFPLQSGDEIVGRLTLLWRQVPEQTAQEESPALALVNALGPALARARRTDKNAIQAALLDASLPLLKEGVLAATADGEFLLYNSALQAIVGWTSEEIREQGWTNLVYPDAEYRDSVVQGIGTLLMGEGSRGTERLMACSDGSTAHVAIWSHITPNPTGGPPLLLGIMNDVSRQEQDLQRLRHDEGLVQLGRRVGTVAHDLNNLLCAVLGHAELLTLTPRDPRRRRRSLEAITRASQSGAAIVQSLLVASGTTSSHPVPTDVARLVRHSVDLARPEFDVEQLIYFEQDRNLPAVDVDPAQLQRALTNLITNARQSLSSAGTVAVSVRRSALPREVIYRAPGSPEPGTEMICVRVSDTGSGFSPDALANLFVPFYTTKTEGHGLGMGVVQNCMRSGRGALDVRNAGGANIALYLPISNNPETHHPRLAAAADGRGRRVWLVDDNRQVLEFSQVALAAAGYVVRAFNSASDVLAAAKKLPGRERPALLVLDLSLPDGHGLTLAQDLATAGISAPIVWISGQQDPGTLRNPGGPSHFLPKPYSGRALSQAITQLLDDA